MINDNGTFVFSLGELPPVNFFPYEDVSVTLNISIKYLCHNVFDGV
jgi:hypothetical protein